MRTRFAAISERIAHAPMGVALGAVVAGILLADYFSPPLWSAVVGFVVSVGMAVARYGKSFSTIYLFSALSFAGAVSMQLSHDELSLGGESRLLHLRITSVRNPSPTTRYAQAEILSADGERCHLEVRLICDESVELRGGEEILIKARISGFASGRGHAQSQELAHSQSASSSESQYGKYMARQGILGQIYLTKEMIIERYAFRPTLAERVQDMARQKIHRLELSESVEPIILAMAIGDRGEITTALRRDYVLCGGAHLLAVSGLHVGYLFALINLLLLPLALFRRGQVARALVAIAVIWGYAAMTGLAPSTIRAAVMFSLLQLSLLVASRYNSLNALCFTAMAMLLWRGENIYDAGFQLSVLAVFAIVEWAMPVIRWVAGWHRLELEKRQWLQRHKFRMALRVVFIWAERWLLSSFTISVAASLITIPLASYLFGQFSLWSVVVGPVMVLLAGVVVGVSLLWILMPMGLLQGVASGILELSVGWMNSLAEWCSRMGLVAYDIRIDLSLCITIYIIYALLTALVWAVEKGAKKRKPTIGKLPR